ncbi:hypothetical protein QBC42DRAFT_333392 [Cladorrhinum samala]|uniref:Uncharacterized protein n=1 Tax=Cladorrhinum samala TaxID=585594 RepID=A0AAV9HHG5_9PEZI|nr:hypothetical protein QBC42DRAFT_333392 [Cladorrhinum samala]
MIPPVEDSVLQNNPQFAALYTTLTTEILNPDGSTRKDPAAKKRAAVRKQLDKHRLQQAKETIIIDALSTLTVKPGDLKPSAPTISRRATRSQQPTTHQPTQQQLLPSIPLPLLDLIHLLPGFLSPAPHSSISPSSLALLLSSPPFSQLPTLLPTLSPLLSGALHSHALSLTRLALPATNPSFLHRSVASLPTHVSTLLDGILSRKASLTKSRLAVASRTSVLLSDQVALLARLVKSLEGKHGPVARSLEYRAAEAGLEAEKQSLEVGAALQGVRREVYSPEVVRALTNYAGHLKDARGRLTEKIKGLELELESYEAGGEEKERKMREMARVWREMSGRIEDVRGDLERLGRA